MNLSVSMGDDGKVAYDTKGAAFAASVDDSTIRKAYHGDLKMNGTAYKLTAHKNGAKVLILKDDLVAWIRSLPLAN